MWMKIYAELLRIKINRNTDKKLYDNKLGDAGLALEGLAKMFRNPEGYNVLPVKHNYTKSGDYIYSGYFIPAFTFVAGDGYIDSRGVTNTAKAKEYYEKRFLALVENPKEYITFKAEYCFTPDDALALEGDNIFNTELLAEQKALIELHKQGPKPEAGFLDYKFKNGIQSEENKEGFKWTPSNKSKLQILEHPIKDEAGKVFRNLYVAGIDSIDLGQRETSKATKHPSDFCIIIYKRMKGTDPPMPVAMYKDRPGDVREAYKVALKLLEYYNCKALLEFSKIGFKNYLQERKVAYKYLMFRPRATMDSEVSGSKQLGAPATEKVIQHQLELIASYVLDYCGNIWFIDIINQLLEYSYENKTKFDCVASMGMALLADEELLGVPIRQDEIIQNTWKDIGWYVDENGRKKFGTIPDKKDNQVRYNFNDLYDTNRIRTSRPNYY